MINFKKICINCKFKLILLIFIKILIIDFNNSHKNFINIPELINYDVHKYQKLKMFTPSIKCSATLYFSSNYTTINDSIKNKIKTYILKDKNDFITFYGTDPVYNQHFQTLENNGLIRSYYLFGKHNLFITAMQKDPLATEKSNIYSLNKYQKVYTYLNAGFIFQKNTFYKFYISMKKKFSEDFNYMPETYIYPEDEHLIYDKFKAYTFNSSNLWLIKPSNDYRGHGIELFESLNKIKLKEYIITKYIQDINLINGKKYDLRLYVLVTGLKPLRIYFYKEGLVRIASERYSLNISSFKNKFVYLTNICVNSLNKKYIKPNNTNDNISNLWNILMYKNFLQRNNVDWEDIREKIKDIIIKSIISVYKNMTEYNDRLKLSDQSFYNIFGFNILINDKFIPKLMEINFIPSMAISNNIDERIKSNLFPDTINLVGIMPFKRKNYNSLFNIFKFRNDIDDNIKTAICEMSRPRGGYELIFPTIKTINKYKKYFFYNTKENIIFWDKIEYI